MWRCVFVFMHTFILACIYHSCTHMYMTYWHIHLGICTRQAVQVKTVYALFRLTCILQSILHKLSHTCTNTYMWGYMYVLCACCWGREQCIRVCACMLTLYLRKPLICIHIYTKMYHIKSTLHICKYTYIHTYTFTQKHASVHQTKTHACIHTKCAY